MHNYTRAYGELLGAPEDAPAAILALRALCVQLIRSELERSGTITAAAERLGVARPTLSRWKSAFPEELG